MPDCSCPLIDDDDWQNREHNYSHTLMVLSRDAMFRGELMTGVKAPSEPDPDVLNPRCSCERRFRTAIITRLRRK